MHGRYHEMQHRHPHSPVIQILGLDHLVLRVRDGGRMTRFYCDVLGCKVERVRQDSASPSFARASL